MSDKINPWLMQAKQDEAEDAGAEMMWRFGWKFSIRRECEWNLHYARAKDSMAERGDVKSWLQRTRDKSKTWTDAMIRAGKRFELEAWVSGHLVGWEGVTDKDGKPLPFSTANALTLLETFKGLHNEMRAFALDVSNYQPDGDDDTSEPSKEAKAKN